MLRPEANQEESKLDVNSLHSFYDKFIVDIFYFTLTGKKFQVGVIFLFFIRL